MSVRATSNSFKYFHVYSTMLHGVLLCDIHRGIIEARNDRNMCL